MANVYNIAKKMLVDGDLDLDAPADIRCMLFTDAGPPAFDPDEANITAVLVANTEVSVGGYARQELAGEVTSQDDANNRADCSATKATFAALVDGETVAAALVYLHVGADGVNIPMCWYNVTDTATNGGNIEIRFDNVDGVGDYLRLG